ncbi:CoA transferase subunit A [Xylanimonas protaetiae]|uniref:3-oxoacid CoA-transferase subunit A n=1 Tax=Xylanimonas protaetiae TaxID=2509457 RepID=A0A4P6F697_9MICO|nr:CoA transferase subunit A [Xylanimonas protaetiae]QAY70946.1 3-oxoacid CoA-transferase subunit A [Xylanimonas protaetiae]
MTVLHPTAGHALDGLLHDGMTIAVGGFGLSGNPNDLIEAVRDAGVRDLTVVSNNMGVDGLGLGILLENDQVRHVLASYVGENKLFARRFLDGDLDVEFVPQGTLAERLRAGGAGIPAFFTATGVGTPLAEGKPVQELDGRRYVLERAIVADLALVHAYRADRYGNLVYRRTARNFNPLVAAAGRVTVVEAEHVDDHPLDPDVVVTPGIYVDRLVPARERVKDVEQRTVRPRPEPAPVREPVEVTPWVSTSSDPGRTGGTR